MKYLHKIIIGKLGSRPSEYSYNYGNTKDIKLAISKKGVSIEAMLSKRLTKEEMLASDGYLFPDALKKALLIYLIKYSKSLTIKTLLVQIDETFYQIEEIPKIYSLIEGELNLKMHVGWRNEKVIQDILWFTKSTSRQRMASLYALLTAKSKRFEIEKFMYLWIAFNGMYGYLSQLKEKGKWYEWQELIFFQKFNGWGKRSFEDNKIKFKLYHETKALLKCYASDITKKFFNTENGVELDYKIQQMFFSVTNEVSDLSAYGFLITQFAYWLRCELFHANRPTMFFLFDEDMDLKYLRQINSLLEEYLDENLYKWFDKEYRENYLKINAQKIERPVKKR